MENKPLIGLAARLVAEKIVDLEEVQASIKSAQQKKISLSTWLIQKNKVPARILAEVTSREFGLPVLNIDAINPDSLDKDIVPIKLIKKHQIIPLIRKESQLFVGIIDPTQEKALEEFRFNTGLTIFPVIVEETKLENFIEKVLDAPDSLLMEDESLVDLDDITTGSISTDETTDEDVNEGSDTPVVKFVNKMLLSAIKKGASDLHFEPYEKSYRVRFRTDGILEEINCPPKALAPKISSRLKIMSAMDISERRKPQDGRIKLFISKTKSIDFRVNTCPTLWGEKIVLRILDSSSAKMGIDALGYEPDQKKMYLDALHQPQGMILVTGPTGSGKTVSLYTGLNILNTTERNISTAEDPVEINLEGINQVNVNNKQGMGFSESLRAFLRQDPDIIMVGEIRDLETANIAIKAAQTGHMVLSTLHTNSAPETLTRLNNMGVPPFNIATSVSIIIAQRLARRLCNRCKEEATIPDNILKKEGFTDKQIEQATIFNPIGCDQCSKGYKGRVGIYEVVQMTPEIQKRVMEEGNSIEIAEEAKKAGFKTLRESGIVKILQGVTTLEEINRVTAI